MGKHGHELVIIQLVEPKISGNQGIGRGMVIIAAAAVVVVVALIFHQGGHVGRLDESDAVANRPAVGPASGGREVQELINPTGLMVLYGGGSV
jgi:hypothetical protein